MRQRGSRSLLRAYRRETRGAAALELALCIGLLTLPVLNVVDLAYYAYDSMQTQNAAQMGANAVYDDCNSKTYLPAATKCTSTSSNYGIGWPTNVQNAIQETTLGNSVTLVSGYPQEGFYCSTTGDTITNTDSSGVMTSSTADCSKVTNPADSDGVPGDYALVRVSYTYHPVFSGVTVTSLLPATITGTAYVRLD